MRGKIGWDTPQMLAVGVLYEKRKVHIFGHSNINIHLDQVVQGQLKLEKLSAKMQQLLRSIRLTVVEFCEHTTLHGYKYLIQTRRHPLER